jgi:hypothetical protein
LREVPLSAQYSWLAELQSFCQALSEGVLDVIKADLGALGEDADHVEAQGLEVWLCGVEVVFGYGAQGILLAGVTASSGSPKPVPRRSLTSTKTSVLVLLYKTR